MDVIPFQTVLNIANFFCDKFQDNKYLTFKI